MTNGKSSLARLGDITSHIASGSTPRGGQSVYLDAGPVMLVRSQNVRMNTLDLRDVAYISEDINSEMRRSIVQEDDVLLNITGASIGRVARFNLPGIRANVNQHVCIIRPMRSQLDSRFLTYYLSSPQIQHDINHRHQHGGTRQALTFSQISEFKVPLPPLSEQKRIADILDKADVIRQKRRQQLDHAQELRGSLFFNRFGDPGRNNESWPQLTFESVLIGGLRNGISPSNRGQVKGKVLVLSAITADTFDDNAVKESTFDAEFGPDQLVRADEFLICRGNGNLRLVGTGRFPSRSMDDTVFPDTMIAAKLDPDRILPEYLEEVWATQHVRRQIEAGARTTNGTHKVNQKVLAKIRLPIPPIREQKAFAAEMQAVQAIQQRLGSHDADELFNSLVQRAFRGEL